MVLNSTTHPVFSSSLNPAILHRLLRNFEKVLLTINSGRGLKRRLSIFIYHSVKHGEDSMQVSTSAQSFDWQMEILANYFNCIPLSEAVSRLSEGHLPPRAACVTFDDGYADNHEVALPILQKWQVPATFFVTTNYIKNGGCMWNDTIREAISRYQEEQLDLRKLGLGIYQTASLEDKAQANFQLNTDMLYLEQEKREENCAYLAELVGDLPDNLMMTEGQVRDLDSSGMEVGSHTLSHPIFTTLDDKDVWHEISASKEDLEGIIGKRVSLFSYPNGKPEKDYRPSAVEMVKKAGYDAAVSTHWGAANRQTDVLQLPRFTPWDRTPERFMLRMCGNYLRPK